MRIALYGFMGSGKSTLGKALAKSLAYQFVDLDVEIERFTGKSINRIFAEEGEIAFRKKEHQVLKEFIKKNDENVVLALGGGSILQPTNRQLLDLRQYYKIFLNVPVNILIERLKIDKANRPLLKDLSNADFEGFVKALYESRKAIYEEYADLNLPIGQESFKQSLHKLQTYLNLN